MVVSTSFGQSEPRRFDIVAAVHAYNDISDGLLGTDTGNGFLARELTRLEHEAETTPHPALSAFLFGATATFEEARFHITNRLYDVQRGILSIAHFYDIAEREGYYTEYGNTHPSRVPLNLDTMMLPATQNILAGKLDMRISKVRDDISESVQRLAESFEYATHPDRVGYHPILFACAARYQQTASLIGRRFDALKAIIRNKPSED